MRADEGPETRDDRGHELAVDRDRERLIVFEFLQAEADCALVCFFNDA